VIRVGHQSDGFAFRLDPRSYRRIFGEGADKSTRTTLFIGYDTKADVDQYNGPMWEQIVLILTQLPASKIRKLGGYRFIDSVTGKTLYESN